MKKVIFTLLFFVFILPSVAQNYSLYEDGMTWVTQNIMFELDGSIDEIGEKLLYVVQGDSTINANNYKRINCYYFDEIDNCNYLEDVYFVRYSEGKYLFYLPEYKSYGNEECFIGDDYVFFDETLMPGEYLFGSKYEKIACTGDTVFAASPDKIRKYWKMLPYSSSSALYTKFLNNILWIEGIGTLIEPIPAFINEYDCPCYHMLACCINANGDTIYKNQDYLNPVLNIPSFSADEVSFTQRGGECVVTLPLDAAWSATLSNSVGVTVVRRSGEGSEIILPATSKGTHILVVNAGGRVVKKKVFIK